MKRVETNENTMKYKWIHNCQKPDVPMKEQTYTITERRLFRRREVIKTESVHAHNHLKWVCDVCGSEWRWWGSEHWGRWSCDYRPEIWKDIE